MSTERQLPYNLEAERAVLGSILMDRDAILMVADRLTPDAFYLPKHGWIFEAMLACHAHKTPADLQMVAERLRIANRLQDIGDMPFLVELTNSVPTAYHIEYYAQPVEATAMRRRLIQAGGKIAAMGYDEEITIDVVSGDAFQELTKATAAATVSQLAPIGDAINELYGEWEEGVPPGTRTGFVDLDRYLGGWQAGDLLVLGARPSVGKSALAAQLSYNIAQSTGRVLFFSLEMSRKKITQRFVCQMTGFDLSRMSQHKWGDAELPRLLEAAGKLSEMPIAIDDSGSLTINGLRSVVMKDIARNGPPAVIIVDYLQRVRGNGKYNGNRVNEVGDVSKGLKALAMEAKCPVLALASLSRGIEQRVDHAPQMSDLRESGDIESDADIIMFIHREERYDKDTDKKGIAEIHIAKNRQGPLGIVALFFDARSQGWRDLAPYQTPEGY